MKILRFFSALSSLAALATMASAQVTSESETTFKAPSAVSDDIGLNEAESEFDGNMGIWMDAPRSQTALREAYTSALSLKLALLARSEREKNPNLRSLVKKSLQDIKLAIGHLEEIAGTDLASKKLADASLDIAADAAKRNEFTKAAVAAAVHSFATSASDSEVDKIRTDILRAEGGWSRIADAEYMIEHSLDIQDVQKTLSGTWTMNAVKGSSHTITFTNEQLEHTYQFAGGTTTLSDPIAYEIFVSRPESHRLKMFVQEGVTLDYHPVGRFGKDNSIQILTTTSRNDKTLRWEIVTLTDSKLELLMSAKDLPESFRTINDPSKIGEWLVTFTHTKLGK